MPFFVFMKKYAERFYKSTAWVNCRNSYMSKVGGLCEKCKEKGRIVPAEEVHHKTWLNPRNLNDPSITLNYDNLIALCRECHRREHNGREEPRYIVDELGRVTPR